MANVTRGTERKSAIAGDVLATKLIQRAPYLIFAVAVIFPCTFFHSSNLYPVLQLVGLFVAAFGGAINFWLIWRAVRDETDCGNIASMYLVLLAILFTEPILHENHIKGFIFWVRYVCIFIFIQCVLSMLYRSAILKKISTKEAAQPDNSSK